MSAFLAAFHDEISFRLEKRRRARELEFARQQAQRLFAQGKTNNQVATMLTARLGCPCCGPRWWKDIVIQACKDDGLPIPTELQSQET